MHHHHLVVLLLALFNTATSATRVHLVHWNSTNPMFRIDNTDNVIDVNVGNVPWEYDQANIICPVDHKEEEQYIIYNVSKEEYETCRITNPNPRVVADCSTPHVFKYFTITFRSFTPTPGGLEFYPGQDYYFITTSRPGDLKRRAGGRCSTHNMKVIFKVADNKKIPGPVNVPRQITTTTTTEKPLVSFQDKNLYYPVLEQEETGSNSLKEKTFPNYRRRSHHNEVVKQEASRMHAGASSMDNTKRLLWLLVPSVWLILVAQ